MKSATLPAALAAAALLAGCDASGPTAIPSGTTPPAGATASTSPSIPPAQGTTPPPKTSSGATTRATPGPLPPP